MQRSDIDLLDWCAPRMSPRNHSDMTSTQIPIKLSSDKENVKAEPRGGHK